MTTTTAPPARRPVLLRDLDRASDAYGYVTPNWFAAVMGTGIVAVAATSVPVHVPGLRTAAVAVWALTVVLFLALVALTVLHWRHHPEIARSHREHPVFGPFYGAVPMAVLTVGTSTLLVGSDVIGTGPAVAVDATLWTVGTVLGLVTVVLGSRRTGTPFGGWLMPVVPPTVSASAGALLVPHVPAGGLRLVLLVAGYGLLAVSLVASTGVIATVVREVRTHGPGPVRMTPTLFIVLGPLGQSITAFVLLGAAARGVVSDAVAAGLGHLAVGYGVPVAVLAAGWLAVAIGFTVRAARAGLPFGLTWWSFTFPVGTCATGAAGLARSTGLTEFRVAAVVLFATLVGAWLVVAARTLHGGLVRGYLLAPPA